jgi:3'-phosphoadenosine 5'-phosphosulfate sulfotransferase (PAPS reductase)/FAD synthetase
MNLHNYDIIIINSSGGKDSLVALWKIYVMAVKQKYALTNIHVSHQDLGRMEWKGTKELVQQQATLFGLQCHYSKRVNKAGYEEDLLEYVKRRKMFPSNNCRYCTSDFKRGPGAKVVTRLTKGKICNVLYVFGFRADESPARKKKEVLKFNSVELLLDQIYFLLIFRLAHRINKR